MVRALMKSQKEVDQAKSSNNKVASANSTKKEEKNLKKSGVGRLARCYLKQNLNDGKARGSLH
jgi:hypothetical protein